MMRIQTQFSNFQTNVATFTVTKLELSLNNLWNNPNPPSHITDTLLTVTVVSDVGVNFPGAPQSFVRMLFQFAVVIIENPGHLLC